MQAYYHFNGVIAKTDTETIEWIRDYIHKTSYV